MWKSIMGSRAYIVGNLDCAIYFENGRANFLPGKSDAVSGYLDNYLLSQMFAINSEITITDYTSIEDLQSKLNTEHEKQEALSMALELMDPSLSEFYRKEIAGLLAAELDKSQELTTFLQNRFLATPLPKGFNAPQAKETVIGVSTRLSALYDNLEEKAQLFTIFYTLLISQLNLKPEEQEQLDLILTDNGAYALFTLALYQQSKKKYDTAVIKAIPVLEQLHVFRNRDLFNHIQEQLTNVHHITLEDNWHSSFSQPNDDEHKGEDDPIITLITRFIEQKETKHNRKQAKRGGARRVESFDANIVATVTRMKEWVAAYGNNMPLFLREFYSLAEKQLRSGHPAHLCKTCCDLAANFTKGKLFELSRKLLEYAKLLNAEDKYVYSQEAALFYAQGKLLEALKKYEAAVQKFPNQVVAYSGKAEVLRNIGRLEDALAQYDIAIQKFPNDEVAYNGKAEVLRNLGELESALAQYDITIQKFPNDVVAYNGKAEVLRDLGTFENALQQYSSAIQKFPNEVVPYSGKAEVLRNLGRFEDALAQYNSAIQKFPNEVFAYSGKAEVLRDLGRLDEALAQYTAAIQKFPYDVVAYNGKAEVLRDWGKLEDALLLNKTTQKLFPYNGFVKRVRMQLLLEIGQYDTFELEVKKDNYHTDGDFIELHMYCMYLVKTGEWEIAQQKIEFGLLNCPYNQRKYFKGLYSYLKILQKDFKTALHELDLKEKHTPAETLLIVHANAESNNTKAAIQELHTLDSINRPVIRNTISYLSERYSLNGFEKTGKPTNELDKLIADGEMIALLQYADFAF